MADFDMTGWEEISPEEVGVYINDKNDSINASNFDDATDVRYKYNTGIEREDNWKFIGKTKITGELAELQRNIFSSTGRGVWNGLTGLARGASSYAIRTAQLAGGMTTDVISRSHKKDLERMGIYSEDVEQFSERFNEACDSLDKKTRKWIDTLSLSQDQKDQEVAYNMGNVVGQFVSNVAIAYAMKAPQVALALFGVSAGGDIANEILDKGGSIEEAMAVSTGIGGVIGYTEKIGAEPILNALGKKIVVDQLFKKKALKVLAKSGASEGLEELIQNPFEDTVMNVLGYRDKTVTQIMTDGLEAAAYGAFGGLFGGGVFMPAMIQAKKDTKQKLVDAGLEESKADELADSIVYDQKEVEDAVSELMEKEADQETLTNGSYEEDTKRFSDALKQDFLAEEFEIQETAKQKMIEAGQSEEDAQGYAVMISNFARNISRITGQTPREVWEEKGLNLINENYPQPNDVEISESELTPEEKAKADELDVPFQTDILRPGDEGYEQNLKEKQLNIILSENPMYDDYHLGIRKLEDIKTFEEVIDDEESFVWGDFSREEAKEALKKGEITVYSSYPIKNGVFVSTSYIQAEEYAGGKGGKVYSKTVPLDRVAWINGDEGEFADTSTEFYQTDEVRPSDKEYLDIAKQNEELDKTNPAYEGETININGTDRTVYNSAGERIAKSEAALRNFYNWFGDSKAVDKDGKPLVVYHGTSSTFDKFKKGLIFFSNSEDVAGGYGGTAILKVYLRMENPFIVDAYGQSFGEIYNAEGFKKQYKDLTEDDYKAMSKTFGMSVEEMKEWFPKDSEGEVNLARSYGEKARDTNDWARYAKSKGYDGVIIKDVNDTAELSNIRSDDYVVFNSNQIKSTENRGTFSLQEDNIYYQTAYHGTPEDELVGGQFNLDFSGTGEGAAAHGYGVYATVNYNIADEKYRESLLNARYPEESGRFNEDILQEEYDKQERKSERIPSKLENEKLDLIENLLITHDDAIVYSNYSKDLQNWYETELRKKVINKNRKKGQVYTLDVPEDIDLLDEQKTISKQRAKIKKAIISVMKSVGLDKFTSASSLDALNGGEVYDMISRKLGNDQKQTSKILLENGIKGITYDGREDGRSFVIFDPKDVKVLQTFYQDNEPKQIKRGSYTPTKNLITLFKTSNRSTIIHELGHYFTINYVKVLEDRGLQDELKGFYDWLGIKNINEATTETWERMARGFETYAMEGVAPNVSTQSLFARMKQWLVDVYSDIKGNLIAPEEINDDVREFFDKMLTSEQEVFDLSSLTGKTQEINDIIKNILQGQEVDFQGFSVKDLEHLVKAVNMRLPKLPKNLEQAIRKAGGIDIEFAKAIGIYDEKKGNMHGFFKKNGAIKKEDALIEFLKDKAYLVLEDAKTYGETAEIMDRVTYLLEDAANAYSENDLEYINDRNAISEVIDEASRILQDINYEDITKALKVIKENDAVIVNKNTLEYMKARVKRIEKDHKKVVKEIRKKQKDLDLMRSDVSTYIKEQPISADHKLRLLNKVKNIKDEESFINVVNEVKDRAKDFYLQEQKKLLSTQIHKEIKKSRPKRVTQQKYDYERNVLFKDLRDYDKLTKEKAGEAIINLLAKEDKTETDLIRMRFLNYKANGMSSSTQLMEKVLDDIRSMKQLGSQIKDQADLEAKINREELKQNVMEAIANNKADKNTTKTAIGNLYRKGFTNLYSMINSITSKALADKFEMATVLNDAEVDYFVHTKKVTERMIKLFGLKSKGDLLNKFAELGERVGTLTTINESGNSYEISKMDVIDIYNSMKNEKKRADYIQAYGEPQIMRFVNMLNDKERLMADEMMEDVNSFFPETNKVYVETYGMDLKKVENYWPATSEHSETTDLLADFYAQQETPSFYKERAGGRVVPVPKNAWAKYLKHINESIYMIKIARKYKTIRDTFKSSRVRNRIENKYGKDIYAELMKQIEAISLNARSADLNFVEQVWGKFFNNFVVAKIAVAPTVLAGQFTAITNYAENVDTAEFYKQFTKGLANPKETIEFMQKYEKDFMETRFAGGYSEAVSRVLADAGKANNQRFKIISDKTKFDSINALTYFVRIGDLGSVMFGGYAQIQADLKAGVPLEKALHRFEEQTITSQQSSNKAALSSLQQTTGLGRILLAFKNTAHQYLRKVADSIIQYQRGEITANQCAKVVLNYAVVQPTLYILAKNAVKAALGLDDDDDSIFDGLPETLLLGIFDAVPIVSDILHTTYKGLTGGYISHILSTPGLDDIENSIRVLFKKKDKGVFDWVEVVAPLIEGTTSIPVARYGTMFEKWEED